jgi:SpoIID/LytB domain protein
MGQYGAYGYATTFGWTYQQILGHYYGGTTPAAVPAQNISVRLDELDGARDITFAVPGGQVYVRGTTYKAPAVRVHNNGNGTYTLYSQTGCTAPPSNPFPGTIAGSVTLDPPAPNNTAASVIEVCSLGSRAYQGSFTVAGTTTVDTLPLDEYVAGVVPSESPASWGATGGEAALQAQAVAARSYALASVAGGGAICDTQSCQVYAGDADLRPLGGYARYSDLAASSTAGQVLRCSAGACGPLGSVALTEYSSSTGGYSAGGRFPAVADLGDATSSNPNHTWTANVAVAAVQSAYPQVGTLSAVTVTVRNGLGDLGGRVEALVVSGTAGSVTVSGDRFAGALGLRSDWFAVAQPLTGPRGGDNGYWIAARDGSVFSFGAAPFFGSEGGHHLNQPVVGLAPTPDQKGYWEVASDGGIFTFGDAAFLGSEGGHVLNRPVVGMAATAGRGYWEVASDGGVFTFGDARFFGSTGSERLNQPVVGMAPTPDGRGYWLVASDGGIFTFGDAGFFGSTGSERLNQPVVGVVPTADGRGYTLVARDGGVFNFGDARFLGSLPGTGVRDTITGLAPTADGGGYLLVSAGGTVYPFGDAPFFGDIPEVVPGYGGFALGIAGHRG